MKKLKLKYYLRGLGIGVLVTALILGIAGKDETTMTDAEIRERAIELGMVDGSLLTLADMQNNQEEEEVPDATEDEREEIPEVTAPVENEEPENSEATEPGAETDPEGTAEPETNPEVTAEPEPTEEQAPTEDAAIVDGTVEALNITIESGASSYTVSKLLYENKLVDDSGEFDTYLCENGYSRSIRVGTHKIPMDATWEEIAKIITGKR